MLARERRPLVAGARGEDRLDLALGVAPGRVEVVLDQVLAPDAAAERLPELRLERAERHVAVGARVGPVTDQPARQLEPAAGRRHVLGEHPRGHHRQPRQRAVGHRDVDELALAGHLALAQGDQDPDRGHQRATAEVGDLARRLHRRSALLAGQAEQPDQAEVVHVVARAVAVRPVLPVAGDRAVDEPRVLLAQPLVADPQPLHHAGAEALQQHVGLAHEPQQDLAPRVGLQIDADRALVAVERQEQRAARALLRPLVARRRPAHVVAEPRVLDLQHVGAEVGQQPRAEAARQQPREVEHADALERAAHVRPRRSRASATVAGRRPTSSHIRRARATRSPLERAISPSGR